MSQALLDLGRTQNQINLTQAKYRAALDENIVARRARQAAQGMKEGFDFSKVEGISKNEMLENREKAQAEDAVAPVVEAVVPVVEAVTPVVEETPKKSKKKTAKELEAIQLEEPKE